MRVLGQWRSPGVEHGGKPDAGAEVLGVGRDGDQGLWREAELAPVMLESM